MSDEDDRTVFEPSGGNTPRGPGVGIQVGDVLNHMFAVRRFLARGGMGEVFEGANLATDERVAIKVMLPALADDPNVVTLFRREAQTLTRLHNEAVVQYRVLAQDPELGVLYIVTEYIEGTSLSDMLGKLHPSAAELGALLRRLASGLDAAHRLGAIHRDVSPDNVLLGGDDLARAKLIDFGIAKDLDPGTATVVGDGFAGKLGYVAPEQLGDFDRHMGPWTDVYSLGLVILALARGSDLGLGGTLVDAVDKRRAGLDLSAIPYPLRAVVERMVRPDPTDRFPTMGAVLEALDAAEVPGAMSSRLPRWWPAAATGALLLVVGALFWFVSGSGGEPSKKVDIVTSGNIVDRTRGAIDAALPSVGCTWLKIVGVDQAQSGPRVTLTGVAGNPADAQNEIGRTLAMQNLPVSDIDFSEVSPITQSGCAALDAFRQIRTTGTSRLAVPQRRFEMRMQPPGTAYGGRMAANAVIRIDIGDPAIDFAIAGLEPSGVIATLIPNRERFVETLRASQGDGKPITDLGDDRYRLEVDLDHEGWSGLLLVTGKGPFDENVIAPPLGQRDAAWREKLVSLAAERGWQTDMVWFRSVENAAP